MKKFALFCALFAFAALSFAQEEAPKAPAGDKGNRANFQQRMLENINKDAKKILDLYDANKNGVLDPEEADAFKKDLAAYEKLQPFARSLRVLKAVDADKNLQISLDEAAKMQDVLKEMRPQGDRPQGRRPGMGDRPRANKPAPEKAE